MSEAFPYSVRAMSIESLSIGKDDGVSSRLVNHSNRCFHDQMDWTQQYARNTRS